MTVEPAEERKKKKKEKKANNRKDTKEIKHAHYENTPIQIYWKFHHQKTPNFPIKILIFFTFLLKTLIVGTC